MTLPNRTRLCAEPLEPREVPAALAEAFDATAPGAAPAGWRVWVGGAAGGFAASPARALSGGNGFAGSGGSATAARAWAATDQPADASASAAVYLDSLIPARVFVRGTNLDGTAPTYYAAAVTRGATVQVVRVVNGAETVLGSVTSDQYVSNRWVRVRVTADGDRVRAAVSRTDTGQWLTPDGTWSDVPDVAIDVRDGTVRGAGRAGVARPAGYAGAVTFDDFDARPAGAGTTPVVTVGPTAGGPALAGEVTFRATATGSPNRVEFRLDGVLRSVAAAAPATWALDTSTLSAGSHTLTVRAFDAAGNVGTGEYRFTVSGTTATPIPAPDIPRRYSHIRIAQLAYSGNPFGAFEQNLLRTSVDLVVPNPRYLGTIQATSPNTPQLIYSNVSNLYGGLLTDWLAYADRNGVSRESAFYHVTRATGFSGASSESQPVNWFWGVHQTSTSGATTDVTAAARGGRPTNVTLGAAGTTTAVGYTDRFRELNVSLARGAAAGWGGVWEYATAVNAQGAPTAWRTLTLLRDGTLGLRQSGQITFDPPADWVTAAVGTGPRLFTVRFRTTAGTAAQGPELRTLFGRDYVGANGAAAGTIPAFDAAADRDGDGYLNDAEYAGRRAGMDARFVYESRLFYPFYGQMRFVTNPNGTPVRRWAADYHTRLLNAQPLADGLFLDNAHGRLPFPGVPVLEPTAGYAADSGALVAALSRGIGNRWVLANTAGGGTTTGNDVAAGAGGAFEEFAVRPLQANWAEVGDLANLVGGRLASGTRYVVIDSSPAGGSPTDPRTQVAALAYYYLLADPDRTFLMFFGGSNPSSSWTEHWSPAAAVNVGRPTGGMTVFATGADPANSALTYRVLAREYGNARVLYKPLSYATGRPEGTTANNTATTHALGGSYRAVNANGTLGPVVTSVTLRNGEGAVLVRA
jgi:hypothetical protein